MALTTAISEPINESVIGNLAIWL